MMAVDRVWITAVSVGVLEMRKTCSLKQTTKLDILISIYNFENPGP